MGVTRMQLRGDLHWESAAQGSALTRSSEEGDEEVAFGEGRGELKMSSKLARGVGGLGERTEERAER